MHGDIETLTMPSSVLLRLLLWKLGLRELVAPDAGDLRATRTTTEYTVYIKQAKHTAVLAL